MLKLLARAKINLTLDILGKRPDGYHEVEMVMQSVALADEVELEKTAQGISLEIEGATLAADESNLAWRAAALFLRRFPSAEIGSDVPFCLAGGTQLATGRGEILRRLADLPPFPVVLAKPPVDVSTAWAYGRYDAQKAVRHPDTEKMLAAIGAGDRLRICRELCNVLESVTIEEHEEIRRLKERMLEQGALAAMMSGSGPTVFALMESEGAAQNLTKRLREETDAAVFCTKTQGAQMF